MDAHVGRFAARMGQGIGLNQPVAELPQVTAFGIFVT
jgi:hypothetical protein